MRNERFTMIRDWAGDYYVIPGSRRKAFAEWNERHADFYQNLDASDMALGRGSGSRAPATPSWAVLVEPEDVTFELPEVSNS